VIIGIRAGRQLTDRRKFDDLRARFIGILGRLDPRGFFQARFDVDRFDHQRTIDVGDGGLDVGISGLEVGIGGLDVGISGLDVGNSGLDTGDGGLPIGISGFDVVNNGLDIGDRGLDDWKRIGRLGSG
jgi:hypothetical protein